MEVLSHVNKRVKGQTLIKLPLTELVTLATGTASQPMVRSFALVYAEMAFDRAAPAEKLAVVRNWGLQLRWSSMHFPACN